jgi:hypothetical protein
METIFRIDGYIQVNGKRSDFIKLDLIVNTREELNATRNKLTEETQHEIHLQYTEIPLTINH